ncbi:hypothetical protein IPM62_03315 [Candidatus Woesebacteria bacterium]|nr:MAG: hypothetical protein IPM62_03315 [Candidatus Woesebacteria bacterium]
MKKLTKVSLEKAKEWIRNNGRPLEKSLVKFHFAGESSQGVISALKTFQNEDGGFGNAMEPDLRTPASSILGTSIALQVLRSLEIEMGDLDFVKSAVQYILKNYNEADQSWRIIPRKAEDAPHAPWWNQTDREDNFHGFHLNPAAEILGYLYDYKDLVPAETILSLSTRVLTELRNLNEIEMHDFLCCKRLYESKNLNETLKKEIELELLRLLDSCILKDLSRWSGYGLRPLQVVDSPDSIFINKLAKSVGENLDYEIDTQDSSGAWFPTWSWGDNFQSDWDQAKNEWTGIITLDKLKLLKIFGRIEP